MSRDTLKVSCLQFDIKWEDKKENINRIEALLKQVDYDADIIVLPEMFTTGFSMNPRPFSERMSGPTLQWMLAKSKALNAIITGSIMVEEFGRFRNRLLWVKPSGSISFYDKRHPFCLIEEGKYFEKGELRGLFTCDDWKIMPSICYDLRFPVWLRNDLDYDILLNVANWPSVRSYSWKQFCSARALENQSFVIALNRVGVDSSNMNFTGDSRIVSFDGKSLQEAGENRSQVITEVLSKEALSSYRKKYPFLQDSDSFHIENEH